MKISELRYCEATKLAIEAQQKGISIVGVETAKQMQPDSVHFIGVCQLIAELRAELRETKAALWDAIRENR